MDTIPPKYNCNICLKVLRDAQLTVCCGQHYCDTCLKEWLNSKAQAGKKSCPHCREENFQSFPNKEKIREIKEFKIRCVHKEKRCVWVGEMDALKDHLSKNCGCVKVKCKQSAYKVLTQGCARRTSSVASICGGVMERRHLTRHQKNECLYRQYECEYCRHIDTYDAIAGSGEIMNRSSMILFGMNSSNHYDECEQYPLQCPNKCEAENIKRKDMKTHRETCPLEPLNCPFQQVGCPVGKILRKDMDSHCKDNMQTHLLLVLQSNKELARKVVELSRKNEELNEEIAHKNEELGCKHEELVHKNEEFEKRIQVLEARRD